MVSFGKGKKNFYLLQGFPGHFKNPCMFITTGFAAGKPDEPEVIKQVVPHGRSHVARYDR